MKYPVAQGSTIINEYNAFFYIKVSGLLDLDNLEIRLLDILLQVWNARDRVAVFKCSMRTLERLGIDHRTAAKARESLRDKGLLEFTEGTQGAACSYSLPSFEAIKAELSPAGAQDLTEDVPAEEDANAQDTPAEDSAPASSKVGFDDFWKLYPIHRRKGEKSIRKLWEKMHLDNKAPDIIAHLEALNAGEWSGEGAQYALSPYKYLTEEHWKDPIVPAPVQAPPARPIDPSITKVMR